MNRMQGPLRAVLSLVVYILHLYKVMIDSSLCAND